MSGEAGTSVTSDAATVTVNALPVITQQPSSQTINEGGNINLEVTATGATGYQWKKDGSDIPSATDATYSKSGALPADAGSYTCVVTGAGGAVESNAAVVTVNALPVITQQPTNQEITEGDTLTLNVVATGATSYQWKKGEEDILDATTATYTKEGATAADSGSYTCVVTGAGGSVTSNAATVTVNPAGEA